MKIHQIISAATVAFSALMLWSCGPSKPILNVYMWSDYIDPELVQDFEKANNCKVRPVFNTSQKDAF